MKSILTFFFDDPARKYHVRELAKLSGISAPTVSRQLRALHKEGLLTRAEEFGRTRYALNLDDAVARQRKITHTIETLHRTGLIPHLVAQCNEPEAILLFGSARKGEDGPHSDIDICIITPRKEDIDMSRWRKESGHPINILIFSRSDIERMKKTNKELLNNLINGIVLHGSWEVFR